MRIEVDGTKRLGGKLAALAARSSAALDEGLGDAAKALLDYSLDRVPVDTRALYDSGRITGSGSALAVEFGGPDAPYAIYVHEDLEAEHAPPTSAKFLEGPYLEHRGELVDIVSDRVRRAVHD